MVQALQSYSSYGTSNVFAEVVFIKITRCRVHKIPGENLINLAEIRGTGNTTFYLFKDKNEKYSITDMPDLNVNILLEEFDFISRNFKKSVVLQYITYRYGVLPSMYQAQSVNGLEGIYFKVLFLCWTRRSYGSARCFTNSSLASKDFGLEFTEGLELKNVPKTLTSEKTFLETYQLIFNQNNEATSNYQSSIYDKWCSRGKVIISRIQMLDTINETIPNMCSKLRTFIFKNLNEESAKKNYMALDNKQYFINPEVAQVIKSFEFTLQYLGKSNSPTSRPEDYSDSDNVFAEINNCVSFKNIQRINSKFLGKGFSSTKLGYPKEVDPFFIKSVMKNIELEELMYVPQETETILISKGILPAFREGNLAPEFEDYRNKLLGTARELVVQELNAYPFRVWDQYIKRMEAENPNDQKFSYYYLYKNIGLVTLSFYKERNALLFYHTIAMSITTGITYDRTSFILNEMLLKTSQVLVSLVWNKKFANKVNTTKETCFILVGSKNAQVPNVADIKRYKVILWNKVKSVLDCFVPMLFGCVPTRGLVLVSKHHDQYAGEVSYTGAESKVTYCDKNPIKQHELNATGYYPMSKKKYGHYMTELPNWYYNTNTRGYHEWFKKEHKTNFPITSAGFLSGDWKFDVDVMTLAEKKIQSTRILEVQSAKRKIKKLSNTKKELLLLWKSKDISDTKRNKVTEILKNVVIRIDKLKEITLNALTKRFKTKHQRSSEIENIVNTTIYKIVGSSLSHPSISFLYGRLKNNYDAGFVINELATEFNKSNFGTNSAYSSKIALKERYEENQRLQANNLPLLTRKEELDINKKVALETLNKFVPVFTSFVRNSLMYSCTPLELIDCILHNEETEYYKVDGYEKMKDEDKKSNPPIKEDVEAIKILKLVSMFIPNAEQGLMLHSISQENYSEINKKVKGVAEVLFRGVGIEDIEQYNKYLDKAFRFWQLNKELRPTINKMKGMITQFGSIVPKKNLVEEGITPEQYAAIYQRKETIRLQRNARFRVYHAKRKNKKGVASVTRNHPIAGNWAAKLDRDAKI